MIAVFVVFLLLSVVTIIIYFNMNDGSVKKILNNEKLDNICKDLSFNSIICNEIMHDMQLKDVKVEVNADKKSDMSYYSSITNKIYLSDKEGTNKSFARVLFISHECAHARQNKAFLNWSLTISAINFVFTIFILLIMFLNLLPETGYLYILLISFLLNFFAYFARNIIESDASYMAIGIARKYLQKHITIQNLEEIMDEYSRIISFGFSTFQLKLIKTNLICMFILITYMMVKIF
ncbi:MAG: zinc metallopeptidase [Endomicrobiaceae bacterium]|nr:zinc metallopeptidase [Endomicrobiaceae bacterium]